eukprot:scaffold9914_cov80-Skeletonema_dohrnii-CCMP3373.AAC.3
MTRRILLTVVAAYAISLVNGFTAPRLTTKTSAAARCDPASHNLCHELTTVGSKEYYQGFLNRSPSEEPIERVTGDAVFGPTLKFAGGLQLRALKRRNVSVNGGVLWRCRQDVIAIGTIQVASKK